MTREEIIQAISNDKMMPFIQPEQLAQIVAFVIENYRPSLPSNLDEAAEEFGKRQGVELAPFAKKFFKAGAEWMAGQGASYNTKVGWIDGPKPSWKPSEEQLDAARYVSQFDYGGHRAALVSLYEQLKQL